MSEVLSLSNPVFSSLVFCSGALILKMFAVTLLTIKRRVGTKTVPNPEDTATVYGGKVRINDSVERARRNHLNDLENIPAFILLGLLYTLTDPNPSTAIWHFKIFTVSRLLHTICYQLPVPQPSRALTFFVGMLTLVSMAVRLVRAATF